MLVIDNGDAIRGIAEVASKLDFTVNGYVGTTATQLADGQLSNAEADLYASGANATVVTSITIVNTDSAARTFTLYLKPSAGTSRAISPVSLDLGIGHSFYTDGQRMVVVDTTGQIINSWAVDDSPVNGATTVPISSNYMYDHEESAAKHMDKLMTTKGDVVSYSTVPARLGVGTNDYVLTADSTQATGLKWATVPSGATKEFFLPVHYSTTQSEEGKHWGILIDESYEIAHAGFYTPHDFTSITEAVVVRIAKATATHRLNYYSEYGLAGEAYNTNAESVLDQDTAETATLIYEADISGCLSSLTADDYVALYIQGDATNQPDDLILGVRLKYA